MPIDVTLDGPVALVTLNRPERMNALDEAHYAALSDAFVRLRDDDDVRAVVVAGAGERAFSAGADLKEKMVRFSATRTMTAHATPLPNRGLVFHKPLLAAVNGHCLAGGLCLALAADIRLAAPHATFGLSEVKRGRIAGNGGTYRLATQLPPAIAMEMLLTGDSIDAETALRWGIVNRIVPAAELVDATMALARRIAGNAPLAVRAAKEVALMAREADAAACLRLEQTLLSTLYGTQDWEEGDKSFVEKRPARYIGA